LSGWHHAYNRLQTRENDKVMKMLRAPRVEPPSGVQMSFGRVASGLGWVALGALAVGTTARALLRSGRSPSTDDEPDGQEPDGQEPDVLLDVSELEVDRITLEVEDLRAHVSVLAELANLVSLSVGVDARLDRVKLEIEGVEAEVLLKVRLKHIRAILEKALDTIAEHPEILRILSRSLSRLVRESLGEAQATLEEALEGLEVGDTVDEVLRGRLEEVRATLEEILEPQEVGGSSGEGVAREALGGTPATDTASSAAEEE
jgi:exonuclease VII small subunit